MAIILKYYFLYSISKDIREGDYGMIFGTRYLIDIRIKQH